jgi:arylsulfatase A-like enzyme
MIHRLVPILLATAALIASTNAAEPPRLNILTIVADDVGWHDLGFHGSKIKTPHIDRLAAGGVKLDRFYVNPICSVTRSALMTGQFTLRTGVNNSSGLPLEYRILPQDFRDAGWQTWMCGKWHLGGSADNAFTSRDYHPDKRGFSHFYGLLGGAVDYYTHENRESGGLDWWRNGEPAKDEGYSTDLLAAEVIKLLKGRDKTKPFLLHLAFNAAHGPLNPPPSAHPARGEETYAAVVSAMDAAIGRVLEALDSEKLADSTLVVFFCDNGAQEGRGGSNAPLRGAKGETYEGGVRSAAVLRGPGLKAGSISQQWMWVGDLWPTLASAAGLTPKPAKPFDGVNLWPSLTKGEIKERPPFELGNKDMAWFAPPWKLIVQPGGAKELYNLSEDPGEQHDLATQKSEMVAQLSAAMEKSLGPVKRPGKGGGGGGGKKKGMKPGRSAGADATPAP